MFNRRTKPNPAFALSDDDILERLRINDKEVVASVYGICLDLLYKEEDRSKNLDTKGSTLLGVSGLTSTVVFSLGGLLIEKIANVSLPFIGKPMWLLSLLYATSSITLLCCILAAILAIRARSDLKWINEEDVFKEEVISSDVNTYKRYMAAHYWSILRNNFTINETKGRRLKAGYWLFFVALIQILPIIVIIGTYSYQKGKGACIMSENKPPATPAPGSGVTRTLGIFENSTTAEKPAPTPKPTGGSNTTRSGGGGSER